MKLALFPEDLKRLAIAEFYERQNLPIPEGADAALSWHLQQSPAGVTLDVLVVSIIPPPVIPLA